MTVGFDLVRLEIFAPGCSWLYLSDMLCWFAFRVHYAGFNVTRPEGDIGKYKSIPHHHRGEVQFLGR